MWRTFKLYKLNSCVFFQFLVFIGFAAFAFFSFHVIILYYFHIIRKFFFFLKEKNLSSMPKGDKQVKSVGMTTLLGVVFSKFNCPYGPPLLNLVY